MPGCASPSPSLSPELNQVGCLGTAHLRATPLPPLRAPQMAGREGGGHVPHNQPAPPRGASGLPTHLDKSVCDRQAQGVGCESE